MAAVWRIELLGTLRATREDAEITRFETRKTAALLAFLALSLPKATSREVLVEHLWPDEDPEATRARLRQSLTALRRVLEAEGAEVPGGGVLLADRSEVRLNAGLVTTDVAEFGFAIQFAVRAGTSQERRRHLQDALSLYQGELLPGYYEEFILSARRRLAESHRAALRDLAAVLADLGEYAEAIQVGKQAVAADPADEEAHVSLMRLYRAARRPSEALRQARELERVLRAELDAEPSEATRALVRELQADASISSLVVSGSGVSTSGSDATLPWKAQTSLLTTVEESASSEAAPRPSWLRRHNRLQFGSAVGLTALLGVGVFFLAVSVRQKAIPSLPNSLLHRVVGPNRSNIAVLPFDIISSAGRQDDYFADGLTEEMTDTLGKIQSLTVLGRISAKRIKDSLANGRSPTAQELDVGTLITGKISKEPSKLRIYVEAVDAQSQRSIWSEEYDKPFSANDVLEIEADVAQRVARSLRVRLTAEEQGRIQHQFTDNSEAYDFYLQGRYLWNQRTEDGLKRAVLFFGKATALDPHYAPAYVGEADAYDVLGYYGYLNSEEAYRKADQAATQALTDADGDSDTLASAYTALAWAKMVYRRDWSGAEGDFQEALRLSPEDATTHQWHSLYLMLQGRSRESMDEAAAALRHDPLSFIIETSLGGRFYHAGLDDRAIQQYDNVLELNPDYKVAYFWRGLAEEREKHYFQALSDLSVVVARSHRSPLFLAFQAKIYAEAGQPDKAKAIRDELHRRAARENVSPFCLAVIEIGLNEKDQAFALLHQAQETHDGTLTFLEEAAPSFTGVRSDPRFQAQRKQMGLPPFYADHS